SMSVQRNRGECGGEKRAADDMEGDQNRVPRAGKLESREFDHSQDPHNQEDQRKRQRSSLDPHALAIINDISIDQVQPSFILRKMGRLFTSLLLLVSFSGANAFAYGRQGHQAIAELARGMLQPQAQKAIMAILGDDDLPAVSNWADELKQARRHSGPLSGDLEAESLNRRFPDNG